MSRNIPTTEVTQQLQTSGKCMEGKWNMYVQGVRLRYRAERPTLQLRQWAERHEHATHLAHRVTHCVLLFHLREVELPVAIDALRVGVNLPFRKNGTGV